MEKRGLNVGGTSYMMYCPDFSENVVDISYFDSNEEGFGEAFSKIHAFSCFSIVLILSGSGSFTVNGVENEIKVSRLFFIGKKVLRYAQAVNNVKCIAVFFSSSVFDMLVPKLSQYLSSILLGSFYSFSVCDMPDAGVVRLKGLINSINSETGSGKWRLSSLTEASLLSLFLLQCIKAGKWLQFSDGSEKTDGFSVYSRFCYALSDEANRNFSVRYYADELGVSPKVLEKAVKKFKGTTPMSMINAHRTALAVKLLKAGTPIADAASALGFYDTSHFSKFFRRQKGIAPKDYLFMRKPR